MAVVAGVVTLAGVWIGSRLSQKTSERDWLREKRADAYLELMDLLIEINSTFAVGLRVSHLRTESALESGHDFDGVESVWHDQISTLDHVELRINMLGGKLTDVYRDKAHDYVGNMMDALAADNTTEERWDAIVSEGHDLIEELSTIGREDLSVARRKKR